ncbi:MAG: helix-turn-helix transcriptional regulator [Ruthenibacterium sp.]
MIRINLAPLLGKQRLKQVDLINATNIRSGTISDLYNECIHSVTIEQINKICKYLNCTVGELFEYIPDDHHDNKSI